MDPARGPKRIPPPVPPEKMPRHIAIIMDGNGRWARSQSMLRVMGHEEGARSVREVTTSCAEIGVERLTLYAFSAENWKRPQREINFLMKLLRQYLVNERPTIADNDIRFTAIGRLHELPPDVQAELNETICMSQGNRGMVLCLALSYGGRAEILDATRRLAEDVRAGRVDPAAVDEPLFRRYLYDPQMPDPDLLIRTAGEMRVSNFLLWQISYAEFWVTPVFWPEFRREHLYEGIRDFANRERRFGAVMAAEPQS